MFTVIVALVAVLWKTHGSALQQAEVHGGNLAWILESRLDATLRRIDSDMHELAAAMQSVDLATEHDPAFRAQTRQRLLQHVEHFNEVKRIAVFDAQGHPRFSSSEAPLAAIKQSVFFQHSQAGTNQLIFSGALTDPADQQQTLLAGLPIYSSTGQLSGFITTQIDLAYFAQLFASMDIGPNGVIALRRNEDASLILRRPALDKQLNQPINYLIRDHILAGKTSGTERLASPADGVARITAFRTLAHYPFYIIVSAARTDVLAEWRFRALASSIVAATLLFLLFVASTRLARSETNFHAFFDTADDFLFVLNDAGAILHINNSARQGLKLAASNPVGSPFLDLHPAVQREEMAAFLQTSKRDGHGNCQTLMNSVAGSTIPVETRAVTGQWNCQSAQFILSRDISERISHQQALEQEIMRRRLVLDRTRDGIFLMRANGDLLEFNPAFRDMLGYSPAEMLQLNVRDWDAHFTSAELDVMMGNTAVEHLHIETRHRRKDGSEYDVEVNSCTVQWGNEIYRFGTARDITQRKQAEAALRASEERFRAIIEASPIPYALNDADFNVTYLNQAFITTFGYTIADIPNVESWWPKAYPDPDYRKAVSTHWLEHMARARLQHNPFEPMEVQICCKDGQTKTALVAAAPLSESLQDLHVVTLVDISERKAAEETLRLYSTVFHHAREGIVITSPDGTILDVNDTFSHITGYSREEALGQNPRLLNSGRHDPAFFTSMWRDLTERGEWRGEIWNRRKNGEIYPEILTISAVRDARHGIQHFVALFSDISEIKQNEIQLENLAHHDNLTGLPNRAVLADRLQQAMAQTMRREQKLAVVYLDLDGFKDVNDQHGHAVGDQLLIALAARIKHTLRESDTFARIGGDEFVALLVDLDSDAMLEIILNRILAAASAPIEIEGVSVHVSASLGVSYYPQEQEISPDRLLRQADQAMYQSKRLGKNRFHIAANSVSPG